MIKTVLPLLLYLLVPAISFSQSNQEKAQTLVKSYAKNHSESPASNALKFSSVQSLNSSYADTKTYKNYQHKIDSLKLEGRKIDARIVKMKTDAEINQAKKDSKNLSNQLVATSDAMIDFMTHFKSTPTGWQIKSNIPGKRKSKIYFLNKQLTQVTSVK
ncbi:MAG: hypothetical protein EOP43_00885 [Sphingobacteriaceae bacterium]|nr:MAG: hypothetical protein EOP43_00885 [Sphingobacteriaceae bacterium]